MISSIIQLDAQEGVIHSQGTSTDRVVHQLAYDVSCPVASSSIHFTLWVDKTIGYLMKPTERFFHR